MPHGVEVDSMAEPIVAGGVAGFFLASVAWFLGWMIAQILTFVRRVR